MEEFVKYGHLFISSSNVLILLKTSNIMQPRIRSQTKRMYDEASTLYDPGSLSAAYSEPGNTPIGSLPGHAPISPIYR